MDIIHVKGHQDQNKKSRLTWLDLLNVRSDELATISRSRLQQGKADTLQVLFLESKVQLYIDDLQINKQVTESIQRSGTSTALIEHLTKKFQLKYSTYQDVHWEIKNTLFRSVSSKMKTWLIKFSHDRLTLYGES